MSTSIAMRKEDQSRYIEIRPIHQKGGGRMKQIFKQHGEMIAALMSGVLMIVGWMFEGELYEVAIPLYLLAYIIGGYVKAKEGLTTLLKERELDVNLLMFLAAIGAACIGYWLEGGMLIFIFSLSGALETYTLAKSERDLSSLLEMKPDTARIYLANGEEKTVDVEQLQIGDWLIVKPGERIPADGRVREGESSINEATITGEPLPVDKGIGDEVFAGTLNGAGSLMIEVIKTSSDSLFSKIISLIESSRTKVPKSQQRIERLEKIYAKVIIGSTLLLMVLPHFLLGWSWTETLYRAMVFLVVASPCALVASIMPAILSAVSHGARKGILFKSGIQLESLAGVQVVAFDKTGTLTEGKPKVTDWQIFDDTDEKSFFQAIGSIESLSEHPIGQAIVEKGKEMNLSLERPTRLEALTGWGVRALYQEEEWKIGKPSLFPNVSKDIQTQVAHLEHQGKTVVLVERTGMIVGMIALQDTIRPHTPKAIQQLKQLGVQVVMLTGDQQITAETIAQEAGIEQVYSELLPEEKVQKIEELQKRYGKMIMVGDGVNDAPALATADIGVAMGGAGTDVALETADVVLMNDDLHKVAEAVRLGRRMASVVKQNIIFALGMIAMLVLANFAQMMTLPFGVIGHEGSTILVILNGLRLLR